MANIVLKENKVAIARCENASWTIKRDWQELCSYILVHRSWSKNLHLASRLVPARMLGFFPSLEPEELLYSGIARYKASLGGVSDNHLHVSLFKSTTDAALVGLPGRLRAFTEAFPASIQRDIDLLINYHTLLPYYAAFSRASMIVAARAEMWDGNAGRVRRLLGVQGMTVRDPVFLRSCADCANEDSRRFGAPFWRRVHQLPGIVVCPDHKSELIEHPVKARGQKRFIPLAQAPKGQRVSTVLSYELAVRIAKSTLWLLINPRPVVGPGWVAIRLREMLRVRGWTNALDCVRRRELWRSLTVHVGIASLEKLGLKASDDSPPDWFFQLWDGEHASHPLCMLLLLALLGATSEEFFDGRCGEASQRRPEHRALDGLIGAPCANPTCSAYDPTWSRSLLASNFDSCSVWCRRCGFGYFWRRRYPWILNVERRCKGWEALIRSLCTSEGPVDRIRGDVFLTQNAFLAEAKRLGVCRYHWVENWKRLRTRHRGILRSMRARNPDLTRSQVNLIAPGTYAFLLNRDRSWFDANMARKSNTRQSRYPEIDDLISINVPGAVTRILQKSGPPIRITIASILDELGHRARYSTDLKRLPKARQAIAKHVEDLVAFTCRRLTWIARDCAHRGERLTRRKLRYAVWRKILPHPTVQARITDLLHSTECRSKLGREAGSGGELSR